jgi:hypothetical protein
LPRRDCTRRGAAAALLAWRASQVLPCVDVGRSCSRSRSVRSHAGSAPGFPRAVGTPSCCNRALLRALANSASEVVPGFLRLSARNARRLSQTAVSCCRSEGG